MIKTNQTVTDIPNVSESITDDISTTGLRTYVDSLYSLIPQSPNAFSFPDKTHAAFGVSYNSDPVVITGLAPNQSVLVEAVSSGINSTDTFISAATSVTELTYSFSTRNVVTASSSGTIAVVVRGTSSSTGNTTSNHIVKIGRTYGLFVIQTESADVLGRKLYALGLYNRTSSSNSLGYEDVMYSSPTLLAAGAWAQVTSSANDWEGTRAVLKTDGTLILWGGNEYGQLGTGNTTFRSFPQSILLPTLYGNSSWKYVNSGWNTFAIKSNGTLWGWGENNGNMFGLDVEFTPDEYPSVSSPVQIGSHTDWKAVYSDAYEEVVFGIKTNGTLWSWGYPEIGSLGLDFAPSTVLNGWYHTTSPMQVGSMNNWKKVSFNNYSVLGLTETGELFGWGSTWNHLIGTLDTSETVWTPIPVFSDTRWKDISVGKTRFAVGIKQDGSLWGWGNTIGGNIGEVGFTFEELARSSPVQIGSLYNWQSISAGVFCAAIKTDGTLWTWGDDSGQAVGGTVSTSSPVQVGTSTNWSQAHVGRSCMLAVQEAVNNPNDMLPDPFTFTAITNAVQLTTYTSNIVTVTGMSAGISISVSAENGFIDAGTTSLTGTFTKNKSITVSSGGTIVVQARGTTGNPPSLNDTVNVSVGSRTSQFILSTNLTTSHRTLWSWGYNSTGELGLGDRTHRSSPTQIGTGILWKSIGGLHATGSNERLWGWGNGVWGDIGDGTLISKSSPLQIGYNKWKMVSGVASSDFPIMAVDASGYLYGWGYNRLGILGNEDVNQAYPHVQYIATSVPMASVDVGYKHALMIGVNGTLWAVGHNAYGQLGVRDTNHRSVPTQVGTLNKWRHITAGDHSSFATKVDGSLWAWGANWEGQLGVPVSPNKSSPVQVGALLVWDKISSSPTGRQTAGIHLDGTLWVWGQNWSGQLGDGTTIHRTSPVQVGSNNNWKKIVMGNQCFAIQQDGSLWSWGDGYCGQLGDGTLVHRSSPVRVGTGNDWVDVSKPTWNSVVALRGPIVPDPVFTPEPPPPPPPDYGDLYGWGRNYWGSLGSGDSSPRLSPSKIGIRGDWRDVSLSYYYGLGITSGGILWAWGANGSGQLGTGNTVSTDYPVQIGTGWKQSFVSGFSTSHAIKTNGTLWSWGNNNIGQLGLSDRIHRSSPSQVGTMNNWKMVAGDGESTLAVKTDGTLWAWGYKTANTATVTRSSPVQVGALTDWVKISMRGHAMAIKVDGTLWAWGDNSYGQLGIGTTAGKTSPVQVGASGDWMDVSCGSRWTIACKTDGSMWAWGNNLHFQLGDGTRLHRSSPVQIGTSSDWKQVSTGSASSFDAYSVAMKTDNTIWFWGTDSDGSGGQGVSYSQLSFPTKIGADEDWISIHSGNDNVMAIKQANPDIGTSLDVTPNAYVFPFLEQVNRNQQYSSSLVTFSGVSANTPILITSSGGTFDAGTMSLSGTFNSEKTITSSSSGTFVLTARVQSSSSYDTTTSCIISIGYGTFPFSVQTASRIIAPNPFSFANGSTRSSCVDVVGGTPTAFYSPPGKTITFNPALENGVQVWVTTGWDGPQFSPPLPDPRFSGGSSSTNISVTDTNMAYLTVMNNSIYVAPKSIGPCGIGAVEGVTVRVGSGQTTYYVTGTAT